MNDAPARGLYVVSPTDSCRTREHSDMRPSQNQEIDIKGTKKIRYEA
ncbi:hypothetical protein (plasmid) [Citrobacter freundii]|uniref:Uncharacterized protein n=1 Tax=Enterobacter cloacae TaxID=550 RepID=A0A2L1KMH2_ENTCL|nr:hypothetical protein [Enterobacter cloacae]AVE24069.1 hypothetical protein [Citrobacter freundii]